MGVVLGVIPEDTPTGRRPRQASARQTPSAFAYRMCRMGAIPKPEALPRMPAILVSRIVFEEGLLANEIEYTTLYYYSNSKAFIVLLP